MLNKLLENTGLLAFRGKNCRALRLSEEEHALVRNAIKGETDMGEYRRVKQSIEVSVGDSVRIIRELQELIQNELAALTGIPQSTIAAMENNRFKPGIERSKVLTYALKCHPTVLVFPGWDVEYAAK